MHFYPVYQSSQRLVLFNALSYVLKIKKNLSIHYLVPMYFVMTAKLGLKWFNKIQFCLFSFGHLQRLIRWSVLGMYFCSWTLWLILDCRFRTQRELGFYKNSNFLEWFYPILESTEMAWYKEMPIAPRIYKYRLRSMLLSFSCTGQPGWLL